MTARWTTGRGIEGLRARLRQGLAAAAVLAATAGGAWAQEQSGGTLVFGRPADIFTFDPYNTQDDYSIFTELTIYDRLVRLNADGTGVEPELATEWTVAADGLSADFTLRDGVTFSDGSPLTAEDVVFSLTRAIDQQGSWGFLFSPVKSVEAVDEHTVRLTMSEPFAPLLPALATFAASIYSKANFEAQGESAGEHPLGTGPFMLESWDKGSAVVLTRNPHYWQEGKPYLDGVEFRVVGDDSARILQLVGGEVDMVSDVPASQIEQIEAAEGQVYSVPGTSVGFITLNQKIEPLGEAAVRCAMAHAIDREAIARTVYFGRAQPARSILPSSTFFYDAETDPIGFDLDRARELLATSSVPDGFELTATVPTGNATRLAVAQIWAAALAEIGVTMNIEQVEATTAQEQYNTEQFTVRISAWTNDTPDPDELMGVALDYQPQNGLHSSYRNDEARDHVLAGRAAMDDAERQQHYSELQRIVNRDCPFIYTVEEDRLYASTADIHGFAPNSQGKYGLESVWKDAD